MMPAKIHYYGDVQELGAGYVPVLWVNDRPYYGEDPQPIADLWEAVRAGYRLLMALKEQEEHQDELPPRT